MDMTTFFAYARRAPFGGRLRQSQIDGINVVLAQWKYYGLTAEREWLAYVLATMFHETAATMQAVRETLLSSDDKAIRALDKAFAAGELGSVKTPYWRKDKDGKSWLGRGDVQLTHRKNYEKLGERLSVDLVGNPSLAMDPVIAAKIMIVGMAEGLFTGHKLSDFFKRGGKCDPVAGRKIVNGTDKAKLIAGYYKAFLDAINAAWDAKVEGAPPKEIRFMDAVADDMPVAKSKTVWTIVGGLFGGGALGLAKDVADTGASLLGAIANPWAFGSFALIIVAGCALLYLLGSGRLTIDRR